MHTHTYALQIASTGETVITADSAFRVAVWQKRISKRVLKDKRRKDDVKKAIKAGDICTAWINYDTFRIGKSVEELATECAKVFKGL